jgi:hypothetical protein
MIGIASPPEDLAAPINYQRAHFFNLNLGARLSFGTLARRRVSRRDRLSDRHHVPIPGRLPKRLLRMEQTAAVAVWGASFFATLECELLDWRRFKTQAEARIDRIGAR